MSESEARMTLANIAANEAEPDVLPDELAPGTELMHGQYVIDTFLNAGGFGITYRARDSLDRKIVIKECFPGAFCRRSRAIVQARSRAHQDELASIVRLFVQEARSLSKLQHPNIVGVHQVFEENDTAYMALDFIEGRDLLEIAEDPDTTLAPDLVVSILRDLLGAIGFVHQKGMLHRDISPDNILIDQDMRPVLIDFGAARQQATKQSRVLSALRVVKDGYSPQEFYISGSDQGAYSDLYALGASFYHLIDGEVPPNSQARLNALAMGEIDPYRPLRGNIAGYDDAFLAAIDKALCVLPKKRVQSAEEWLSLMDGTAVPAEPVASALTQVAPGSKGSGTPLLSRRTRTLLLAGVGAAVLIGLGMAITGTERMSGDGERQVPDALTPTSLSDISRVLRPIDVYDPRMPLESGGLVSPVAQPAAPDTQPVGYGPYDPAADGIVVRIPKQADAATHSIPGEYPAERSARSFWFDARTAEAIAAAETGSRAAGLTLVPPAFLPDSCHSVPVLAMHGMAAPLGDGLAEVAVTGVVPAVGGKSMRALTDLFRAVPEGRNRSARGPDLAHYGSVLAFGDLAKAARSGRLPFGTGRKDAAVRSRHDFPVRAGTIRTPNAVCPDGPQNT